MLKHLTLALGAAALCTLGLGSCSSDDPEMGAGDGTVTFAVQLPSDMATRAAFSSGAAASNLHAAAYYLDGTTYKLAVANSASTFDPNTLSTKVTLNLIKGQTYKVVFFAANDASNAYSFDEQTGSFTANYPQTFSEDNACFSNVVDLTAGSTYNPNVTLTRPVSQLNIGTNDLSTPGISITYPTPGVYTEVTVDKVYNNLNLLTGAYSNTGSFTGTATVKAVQPTGQTFPVSGYDYLSMGYYLVNNTDLHTVGFDFYNNAGTKQGGESENNVPMKANYRTNIYGALLTTGVIYDVTIDPSWDGDDINRLITHVTNAADLATALQKGGEIAVDAPISTPVDMTNLTAPVTLLLNAKVDRIIARTTTTNPVQRTIIVGAGVEYPTFDTPSTTADNMTKWTGKNYLANLTLRGTPGSSVKCHGYDFCTSCPKNPATGQYIGWSAYDGIYNVEFANIDFDDTEVPSDLAGVLIFQNSLLANTNPAIDGVRVTGCNFSMTNKVAVHIQQNPADQTGPYEIKNITISDNVITYPAGTSNSHSALYLQCISTGLTVSGNQVTNAPYNGIFVTCAGTTVITDNRVITPSGKDCIKVQTFENKAVTGNVTVTGNYVEPTKNGIRFSDFATACTMTVTGNTINVAHLVADNSAFHGIFMDAITDNPLFIISGNTQQGTAPQAYWFATTGSTTTNAANQISNPF